MTTVFQAVSLKMKGRSRGPFPGACAFQFAGTNEVHLGTAEAQNSEALNVAAFPDIVTECLAVAVGDSMPEVVLVVPSTGFTQYLDGYVWDWLNNDTLKDHPDYELWKAGLEVASLVKITYRTAQTTQEHAILKALQKEAKAKAGRL